MIDELSTESREVVWTGMTWFPRASKSVKLIVVVLDREDLVQVGKKRCLKLVVMLFKQRTSSVLAWMMKGEELRKGEKREGSCVYIADDARPSTSLGRLGDQSERCE